MLEKELYKKTFKMLKASENTLSEVLEITNRKKRFSARTLLVAAVITVLSVGLIGTAIAANLFGMRDMLLPNKAPPMTILVDDEGKEIINHGQAWDDFVRENPAATEVEVKLDSVVIHGLPGSPEYKAAQMWWSTHMQPYDGVILSPEEIAELHGLVFEDVNNHTDYNEINPNDFEPFLARIATESFLDEAFETTPGFVYDLGSFSFTGYYGESSFNFNHTRKGTFHLAFSQVEDVSAFESWEYTNIYGSDMFLMQDNRSSIILADTETAFIMITIHGGREPFLYEYSKKWLSGDYDSEPVLIEISKETLEDLADMININYLK